MVQSSTPYTVPDLDWYRDIVEGAPETILIIDRNGIILFHNAQARGFDPQSFVGTPIYIYIEPEFHDTVRKTIASVFENGQQETYELASHYESSDLLWYTTRLAPIIRQNEVVAVSLFVRDTTHQKHAQQALNQVNLDLENRVDERTVALNDYAHRLEASETLNIALRKAESWQGVFQILAEHSLKALEADLTGIYLLQEGRLDHSYSLGHSELPPSSLSAENDPFLFKMLRPKAIRYIPLDEEAETGCNFCAYVRGQKMKTLMVAPLLTGNTVAGVLYLGTHHLRSRTPDDELLLSSFVESAGNTLHRLLVMRQLEQNINQREHELHVLYEVMSIASEVLDKETLLRKSLSATLQAVHCEVGAIHLTDSCENKLTLAVSQQFPDPLQNYLLLSGASKNLWEKAYADRQVIQERWVKSQSYHEQTGEGVSLWDYLGVPIHAKDAVIGVLSLFGNLGMLDSGQIQLVSTIADQIGLAYETTIKRQHDTETLIFEERQRLARELHDSVSQSLYGLVLSADVGNKLLKVKAYPKLAETLEDIGDVALQALKEMRLMLFELRPVSFESVGLVGALELRLNTVEERAKIRTFLTITGREFLPSAFDLQVYRIATEALNNSLKHSRASEIHVDLSASPNQLEMVIHDNGVGFDKEQRNPGGIGLSSMRERANRISGKLVIDSDRGGGTLIKLSLPLCPTPASMLEALE